MTRRSTFTRWASLAILAFGLAGIVAAQTTTTEIRTGEVLWVQGNKVIVRGQDGVRAFLVSEDARFNLDGREVSVHELKPGQKFAAVVKTTTTPVQEYVTEVKEGEVVNVTGSTVIVKTADGEFKKFTADDLKNIDVAIMKEGKSVDASQLKKGDHISATVITPLPPTTVSETEAMVALKSPPPPPPPRPAVAVAESTPPPPEPKPTTMPKTASPWPAVGLAAVIALACGAALTARRRWLAAR